MLTPPNWRTEEGWLTSSLQGERPTFRLVAGVVAFGAVFMWYGLATPFWGSLAWLGAVLLVVGAGMTFVSLHSSRGGATTVANAAQRQRPSGFFEVPAFRASRTTTWEVNEVRVRCAYCGTPNEVDNPHCVSCGAALT